MDNFKDVIVGGRNFRVFHLGARTALHVQTRLVAVVGSGLVQALSTIDAEALTDEKKRKDTFANLAGSLGGAISELSSKLDDKTTDFVVDAIFKKCSWFQAPTATDGLPVTLELFEGRPLDVWLLLLEGLKFNFGPFIDAIRARLPQLAPKTTDSTLPKPAAT